MYWRVHYIFVVVLAFSIHMYAKKFWNRRREASTTTRRHLDFPSDHLEIRVFTTSTPGLDPSIVRTIPVIVFNPKEFEDGLECAVCLCEISMGEKARILPKCNHGFHLDCIDMWFHRVSKKGEEQKSPMLTKLRSLKRLLSGNRRVNPSSPRNLDVEQGARE